MKSSLAGRRILITRAPHQAPQLADALHAAGAETISIPTIAIVPPGETQPLDNALAKLHDFDWLVLTSANAVDAIGQRMQELQIAASEFARLQIAVVGPATARAVEALGLRVALVPPQAVAESLAEVLRPAVAGKKILLPQAQAARDVLSVQLQQAGAEVTAVDAYRNVVPEQSVERLSEVFSSAEKMPHAVAFTSSSTAQHFFQLLERSGAMMPQEIVLASIGPITSQTLRELGHAPEIEAGEHTIAGLVLAIGDYFSQR